MSAISALQTWLTLEHEAIWLLPVVGARFDTIAPLSRQTRDTHLATRDDLLERLHEAGTEPAATALSYEVGPLSSVAEARSAVRDVESRIAAACLVLVGESSGQLRAHATTSVRQAALTGLDWGGSATAFPGLP